MSSRPFDSLLKQSVTKLVNGLLFFFLFSFFSSFFVSGVMLRITAGLLQCSRIMLLVQIYIYIYKKTTVESVAHYKICMKCGSVQSSLEMQVIADWSTSYCFWIKGGHFLLLDAVITASS